MQPSGPVAEWGRRVWRVLSGAAVEDHVRRQRRNLVLQCLRRRLVAHQIRKIERQFSYAATPEWSELFSHFRTISNALEEASCAAHEASADTFIELAHKEAYEARRRYGHLLEAGDWIEVERHIALARKR